MHIKDIYAVAESIYGEDRVSLEREVPGLAPIGHYLVIHYPNVTITNEHRKSYTKKDLYVILSFNEDSSVIKFKNIYITTTSLTFQEYLNKYAHSHTNFGIHTSSYTGYTYVTTGSTCLGSGPLSRMYGSELRTDRDAINLLTLVDQFLSVESLEGVPYRRLENLSVDRSSGTLNHLFDFRLLVDIPVKLAQDFIASMSEYPIVSTIKGIKYGISKTEGILLAHKFLQSLPKNQRIGTLKPAIFYKDHIYNKNAFNIIDFEQYHEKCLNTAAVRFKGQVLNIKTETTNPNLSVEPLKINDASLALFYFAELYLTYAYAKIHL